MKRILALILALTTVICLFAACGKKGGDTKETPEATSEKTETADEYEFTELEDGTVKITKYNGKGGDEIDIPETINEKNVTVIGTGAFENCDVIKKVNMPSTLVKIEKRAFAGSSVTNVFMQSCREFKSLGEEAFKDCKAFVQLDMRTAGSIGKNAFAGCSAFSFFTLRTDMELKGEMFGNSKKCKFIIHDDEPKIKAFAEKNGNEIQIF